MATQQSPSKTPSRRALGDLTPRAINSPSQKMVDTSEAFRPRSPLKKVTSHIPNTFADKENLLASTVASQGKKRGIEEVDSAETIENAKVLARARADSTRDAGVRLTTEAMQRHTENNPVGLADPGSPTERNTPTPEPEPIQGSQKSNQSFSDFLNYELCASQKSDQVCQPEPAPTSIPTPMPIVEEKRSRAELLRTRLKFGLYKVKTNQASKSGVEIISSFEASASQSSNTPNMSSSSGAASSAQSVGAQNVPNITISSPHREPVFVKANLDPFRPIGKLGQPPIQFAAPIDGSRISSRMIESDELTSSPPRASLPQSVSPDQLMSPVRQSSAYNTPTIQQTRLGEHDEEDIESGVNTAHQRLQHLKQQSYQESELNSSAVQGNAAKGLLKLSGGRR